jgi:hypothetical protein
LQRRAAKCGEPPVDLRVERLLMLGVSQSRVDATSGLGAGGVV